MFQEPFTEKRPWGEFRQYTSGAPVTVKTVFVKKGERLSLQYHTKRTEFWKIISGMPDVTIGDSAIRAKAGDEFFIPKKANHRIAAVGEDVSFLEIAHGDFDENDIVRIKDDYGRT